MANYFNSLSLRAQLNQLGQCRFMQRSEFAQGCDFLTGKKIESLGVVHKVLIKGSICATLVLM